MIKTLIGLALILLELSITNDTFIPGQTLIIGLLPDFLGYTFLLLGQRELAYENDHFYKNIRASLWAGVVALMVYIMDLLGVTANGDFQSLLLQIFLLVMEALCLLRIVRGVRKVGADYDLDVKGKLYFIVWLAYVIVSVLSFVTSWMPGVRDFVAMVQIPLCFAFIALFFNFKTVYETIQPTNNS